MKRSITSLVLVACLITGTTSTAFGATNKVGGSCKKAGVKVKIGNNSAICLKVGKKLIWQKGSSTPSQLPVPKSRVKTSAANNSLVSQSAYAVQVGVGSWFFNFSYSIDGVKGVLKSDPTKSKILYLPVGKLVEIGLSNAAKESHGFSVPGLLIDKEILPGNKASVEFTPDKIGIYPGSCNIQCGRGHASMTFSIQVVSESDYLNYLSGLKN